MDENTKFEYKIITRDKMFPMSSAEEKKLQQELEQQEREYCEYIRLKQKFEQN